MPIDPLTTACLHVATPQEFERDPGYRTCNAAVGEPCNWAKRYDGVVDPPFHAERIESAAADQANLIAEQAAEQRDMQSALETETFREAVLDTGLV